LLISALHLGLFSCMLLGHFPLFCTAAAIPLLPTSFWDRVLPVCKARPVAKGKKSEVDRVGDVDCGPLGVWTVRCVAGLRNLVCCIIFAYIAGTTMPALPLCSAQTGYGCMYLPNFMLVAKPAPRWFRLLTEPFALGPYAFDMFSVPRRDHGWFAAIGRENDGKTLRRLPDGLLLESADMAYRRPPGEWMPSMRWRQFWFQMSSSGANNLRESFMRYHCLHPPVGGRALERVQLFWTSDIVGGFGKKKRDFPELRPERQYNWFCTADGLKRFREGKCDDCDADLVDNGTLPHAHDEPHDKPSVKGTEL